jgi:hypothetical protein
MDVGHTKLEHMPDVSKALDLALPFQPSADRSSQRCRSRHNELPATVWAAAHRLPTRALLVRAGGNHAGAGPRLLRPQSGGPAGEGSAIP